MTTNTKIVDVFPLGYLTRDGLKSIQVSDSLSREEIDSVVFQQFGAQAKIFGIRTGDMQFFSYDNEPYSFPDESFDFASDLADLLKSAQTK